MDTPPTPAPRIPRLRQWYWKFAYIVVAVTIYYLGGALASTSNARGILRSALVFVLILLAARVFRGATELGDEPRPWWRMTGRPLAGFVLGSVFGLATIALVFYAFGVETEKAVHAFRSQEPYVIVTAVIFAALAALYLTSSLRLRALEREARLAEDSARSRSRTTS
jgi:cytochrome c biogenesis protein CcdA